MKKNNFLTNKYTLSLLILLVCLAADIILHKGMSRVMLPESFTDKRRPAKLLRCEQPLFITGKKWMKGINTVAKMQQLSPDAAGFEMDVYFDTAKNYLQLYHDSSVYAPLNIEEILNQYKSRKLSSSIWLDFKNLGAGNQKSSLQYIIELEKKYDLKNKLIIESSHPQFLKGFCDSGFFTSYYAPYFNPYIMNEEELIIQLDSMNAALNKYKVSALSGYYFQYPFLKKFFPNYPILTWTDNFSLSLVTNSFNKIMLADDHVKVVLFP